MDIVFFTRPCFLDAAASLLHRLNDRVEVHLIVQTAPEEQGGGPLGLPAVDLPAGLWPGDSMPGIAELRAKAKLGNVASFHLAVFTSRRAFYPSNLVVSGQVARFVRSVHADILHFDDVSSRVLAIPYFLPRIPLVVSIHDSKPHLGEGQGRFTLTRRLFRRRTRAFIFHSHYARRAFLDGSASSTDKISSDVIPLGIYDVFKGYCNGTQALDGRTVLCFGRISPYKGIDVLVAAAPLVAQSVSGLRVIIAGWPIPGYEIPDLPELPNAGTWETHLRPVPAEKLCELFTSSALVVLPYLESTQSGVVSTAYAFHKPVVATAVGGLPEVIDDGVTGRIVAPRDPERLAQAIVELLLNPEELRQMADNIRRKSMNELSWARLTEMTMRVYRDVLICGR